MTDTKDKHTLSSFAAPTEEDLAYLRSLSPDERKALVEAEIAKGFAGESAPLTGDRSREIFERAMRNVMRKNARR